MFNAFLCIYKAYETKCTLQNNDLNEKNEITLARNHVLLDIHHKIKNCV